MKTQIQTLTDVKNWFTCIVYGLNILGFHPDGDFLDYVQVSTGRRRFTPELAEEFNEMLATCFTVCEENDTDIYEIALQVLNTRIGA